MDNLTAGNPAAHRVRVHYNEASTKIYEGMPVCYEHDTTVNWWGGSVSDGEITESTTVTETSLNPIRYINVVDPDVDNLDHFAGVVAKGGWCGKTTSATANVGQILDIYVPNGAIVPVRANIECVLGRTILSVQDNVQALGNPTTDIDDYGRNTIGTVVSRPVAIAMGTNATLDTTAGLVLAKLCPEVFLFQGGMDDEELIVGTGNSTSVNLVVNKSLIDFKNTDGHCTALWLRTRLSGVDSGAATGVYRFNTLMDAATYGEYVYCMNVGLDVACTGSQTTPGFVTALNVMLRTESDPDMSGTQAYVVNFESFLRKNAAAEALTNDSSNHYWFRFNANGSLPSGWFSCNSCTVMGGHMSTAGVTPAAGDFVIPVNLSGVTYYIVAFADDGV